MADDSYDVVVIGAGLVGLATARALLSTRPDLRLAIVEKEDAIAKHQSSHNSGVVHAGVYYAPGSLKARLCRAGSRSIMDFCAEHGIASDIEIIPIQKIDEAYERMLKGDVKYRFVIDLASLKE